MSAVLILRCLARMSDSCTVQTYLTFLISASVITDRLRGLGALFLDSVDVSFPIREWLGMLGAALLLQTAVVSAHLGLVAW